MNAVAHREVERKYEVPEGAENRIDWSALQGYSVSTEPVEHRMEAVYYDTEDMALARRMVALRRRRGGADDGWHVKHSEPSGRHELQVPLLRTPDRIPASVRNLVAGLTGGRPLRPIATLRTVRRVLMVSDAAGTEVAELAVDDVRAVDERTGTPRAWAEWEVELVDGSLPPEHQSEIFGAVEEAIAAAGGRPSSSRAKIARALGEEDTADAAGGRAPTVEPGTTAGKRKPGKRGGPSGKKRGGRPGPELLRAALGELAEQLVLWDFKVRLDAPDAVHQLRVTSRSLRSLLKAASPFLETEAAEDLDARLRELARAMSTARDTEVVAELLPGRVEHLDGRVDPAGSEALRRAAEQDSRTARARVRRRVGGREHLRLLADVQALAADPPVTEKCRKHTAREVADRLVRRTLRKVVRTAQRGAEAEDAGGTGWEDRLHHLHDVRKAVKRVRYVEAVLHRTGYRPGKAMRRAAADAEEYQDVLGRIMDAAVAERWLAGTAEAMRRSGQDRYAVGALHGAEVVRLRAEVDHGTDVVAVLLSQVRDDLA
ncbi:CHAD domain-containing protein [Kocuria sp. M1R5S2]|uniref:CYTH and CHAD domain-containing protein n=1 Tax=Kocuria rhizosphaerae TaxID=3376285 RepID=UPI0037A9487C